MSKIVSNHEFEANFSFINFYKNFEMHFIFKYCNIWLKKNPGIQMWTLMFFHQYLYLKVSLTNLFKKSEIL